MVTLLEAPTNSHMKFTGYHAIFQVGVGLGGWRDGTRGAQGGMRHELGSVSASLNKVRNYGKHCYVE